MALLQLEQIRKYEFDQVAGYFESGQYVLEIGGGNGFQACQIASRGVLVKSLDVKLPRGNRYYDVEVYDGRKIPFPNDSFDRVFSSDVLEHVVHLDELLREISRVLKPGGIAIHVLPTPSWRFWTSLSHYPYYAKLIFVRLSARIRRPDVALNGSARKLGDTIKDMGFWPMLWQVLVDGPHGEYPSALSELWYFSRVRWLALFKQNGCRVRSCKTTGLFYTGYAVLPLLAIPIRTIMAKVLGSATCIYVIEKD